MMKERQVQVQQRLINYITDKGVTLAHIGRKIDLKSKYLSEFKNGVKPLYTKSLTLLDEFLQNENY